MASGTNYGSLPFKEAIDAFKNKLNIPTERWADVWRDGHNSSFMVAGALKDDLLNDFRKAVNSAIAEGKSIGWFKKEFNTIVAKHGWSHTGGASWRSSIIYQTNMRQSHNAGRYQQLQSFEFWQYKHGDSAQPRAHHLAWHNTVLPKDDPWWSIHFPQNGWGCRCRVIGLSKATMQRRGITPSERPNDGTHDWTDKATGEVHEIPNGIDPGFDYAPQKPTIKQRQKKQQTAKAEIFKPPQRIAPTALSTVKGADVHSLNAKLAEFKTAKPQFDLLGQFLTKHEIKTLFVKASEMIPRSKASRKINDAVMAYLPDTVKKYGHNNYSYRAKIGSMPNGWTSAELNHITVKLESNARFKKVNVSELINAVEIAILQGKDNVPRTLSAIIRHWGESGHSGGAIITWLHELGHQVHFKAGSPKPPMDRSISLTRYGSDLDVEWHAEHFAAWMLNREALARWNNDIAVYFDNLMKKALQ